MWYRDTRALDASRPRFTDVVVKGIAAGGGLYVPAKLPSFDLKEILELGQLPYHERAAIVFRRFGVDVPDTRLETLIAEAYGDNFDHPEIAPVVDVTPEMHVLELWHGPTQAFKDMALQCMPLFFSEAISIKRAAAETAFELLGSEPGETGEEAVSDDAYDDYLILVATSGDTGKAALEGFRDRDHTRIVVFYPAGGVSNIQRKQMVSTLGSNLSVFGVNGNFDDCQNAVKAAFNDEAFGTELHQRHGLRLSSANSINWGRLLPQVVYYLSGYADMVRKGAVKPGGTIDVCVPTGNFGNILAGYYARKAGVPIGRLLCASNENNVLADFIATGVYDISSRRLVTTPSPSMDILVSSNLERLLHELAGPERVREWMASLASDGRFQVDRDSFHAIREVFVGDWVGNDESLATIRRVYNEQGYLMDPHTAVAWEVAERLRGDCPVLIVSTAHWAKFGADVYKALRMMPHATKLPPEAAALTGVQLLTRVQELAPKGSCVPRALAELDEMPERFSSVVGAGAEGVEGAVRDWLA